MTLHSLLPMFEQVINFQTTGIIRRGPKH